MATEITLCIKDDGSMTIETGEKQETPEQEQAEGGNKQPVKSIDEALSMIKQLADAAAMPQDGQQQDMEGQGEDQAAGEEDDAMMAGYRPGATGR